MLKMFLYLHVRFTTLYLVGVNGLRGDLFSSCDAFATLKHRFCKSRRLQNASIKHLTNLEKSLSLIESHTSLDILAPPPKSI